jgi:tetratricopeptide (TPR) repeat protein
LHFDAAQDWAQTWRYARLAAGAATADNAPAEAATHLVRAVDSARHLKGQIADRDVATVLAELGTMRELLGEYDRADDAYRRAVRAPGLDLLRQAELVDRQAVIRSENQGRASAAIRLLRAATARLTRPPLSEIEEHWIRALLSAREADVRWRQGRFSEATECATQAEADAEKSGNTRALALASSVVGRCLQDTGHPDETEQLARALDLYASLGNWVHVALTLNTLAVGDFLSFRWDSSAARLEEAAEEFGKAGDVVNVALVQFNLGDLWLAQGRWEEALAILLPARRTLEACGYRFMEALASVSLGRTQVFLGDTDAGLALLRSASSTLDAVAGPMHRLEAAARLAETLIYKGMTSEAQTAFAEARRLAASSGDGNMSSLLDRIELSLAMASGDTGMARSNFKTYLDRARQRGADYEVLMFLALAEKLGVAGDDAESARLRELLKIRRVPVPE